VILAHLESEILAQYLVNQGFGVWWDKTPKPPPAIFRVSYGSMGVGDEKDPRYLDDRPIGVLDSDAKVQDARSHRTGEKVEFPGVQVRVRALKDSEAKPKLATIAANLAALYCVPVAVGDKTYCIRNYSPQYPPTFLMQEERNNRRVWVISGYLTISEAL